MINVIKYPLYLFVFAYFSSFLPTPAHAFETKAEQAILMDHETGAVLFAKNADERMAPSSMSKMLTTYVVFRRLKDGRLSLDDTFKISERAWRKGGLKSGSSTMMLEPRMEVRVEDLLRGIIVQSGNDASIAVAEGISGSEKAFADELNAAAKRLGLENSHFTNASGWPDENHYSTARDLAMIARATIAETEEYYHYYAEKSYTFNKITQPNRNTLLRKDNGVDGLKTGHTSAGGYGIAASAARKGRRLIVVVNGLDSERARITAAERLLNWGFREYDNYKLFAKDAEVTEAEVWMGESETVPLVADRDFVVTLKRSQRNGLDVRAKFDAPVDAPVKKGRPVGKIVVSAPGLENPIERPLVAGADVDRAGFFSQIGKAIGHFISRQLK